MNRKAFKRKKIIKSPEEVAKLIRLAKEYGLKVVKIGIGGDYASYTQYALSTKNTSLNTHLIIELKETKLEITTRFLEHKPCTYIFNLNGEEIFSNSGLKCFAEFSKYWKLPKASTYKEKSVDRMFDFETGKYACSASPTLGFNTAYENQVIEDVWEYDLNSAYSSILIDKMPDLYHPLFIRDHKVKKGYVGFLINEQLTLVEEGGHADVTFPLIKSPEKLVEFCMKWFNKKKSSTGIEKLEAKAMLNLPIGYCQRFNPFLRSYIVHKCNLRILDLIDDNTLFWNTDAIFSKVRRTDLKIGKNIGEFDEIHYNRVQYRGNTYQCDNEIPVYRGLPKAWFRRFEKEHGRPFDLLHDDPPECKNLYSWNWNTLKLEKNYEEIE